MTATTSETSMDKFLRLRFDPFELDEQDARLMRGGEPVSIAPRPFALLCALARTPQKLVTKNALLDSVWGHRFVSESVLKSTISELRAALQDDAKQPRFIETVSRRGYRFIGTVSALATPGADEAPASASVAAPSLPAASPMIGRSNALERLRAAWQVATAGRRQIVWIAGEAGVGKTTLTERFMAEVGEAHSAHGQCVEQYGAGEPYFPVLEALTALCRRDATLAGHVRAIAPTWLLQLPWLASAEEREALGRELAGAGQARMLREMAELIERGTEDRPLLLVTEDLHWSDHATVQLMDFIARRRSGMRLLWLASFRPTEIIAAEHPFRALRNELRLHGLAEEIVLDAFAEAEVAQYVARRNPALAAEESFVRALHARTEGLPLFVADVVNDLAAHGLADESAASALLRLQTMAVPATLTGIIEHYADVLAPGGRALLEAASVCGVEFRLTTLARVLESDAASLAASCAELVRRQRWLAELALQALETPADARYAFRHALYREVLYKRIGPFARVELHRKVAEALESERRDGGNVRASELASHFELGNEPLRALGYYAEAAEWALLRSSLPETMHLTERAMTLLPRAPQSGEHTAFEVTLATLRGTAAILAHGPSSMEAKLAFERALSRLDHAPDHPLRALFLQALGLVLYSRAELAQASALAERSEALAQARGDRMALVCAGLVHGLVEYLQGRPRIAREWLERALDALEGLDESTSAAVFVGDPGTLALSLLALQLLHLGLVDQGRARMREAYARALRLRAPGPKSVVLWFDALFEMRLDNPQRVAEIASELQSLVDEYASPHLRSAQLWFSGWAQARLGNPLAGYRLIREGYEAARQLGMRADASEMLGHAAEALARAGDWAASRRELEEAMQCANAVGERKYMTQLLLLDARIAEALGDPERARDSMRQALGEARAQAAVWLELLALSQACEQSDATAQDREALRTLLERLKEGLDSAPVAKAPALLASRGSRHARPPGRRPAGTDSRNT
jgi:DNA-binding winged helix-turn-helix (wHTH) protein/tetratricopeptide (TPR) repeat protein